MTTTQAPMRILYVTAGFPYPLTSGFLRHYHFISGLAQRGHQVTLLSLAKGLVGASDVARMRSITADVEVFAADRSGAVERVLRRLGMPRATAAARRLADRAARLAEIGDFDVALLSGKETFPVASALGSLPLAVDMCDATATRIRRTADHARGIRQVALRLAARRMRAIERRLLAAADATAYASVRDREETEGAGGIGAIIPNGVDADYWHRSSDRLGRAEIAFTGAMDYGPNADAAIQLVDEVLPRVRREVDDATLLIVGRDPTAEVVARQRPGTVTVTGRVDDVRPYLDRSAAFAAPIRFGAGIQNKVLEAMAMQVPVVASPMAADGLRLEDGTPPPVTMARTPDEMASALIGLLRTARADGTPHTAGRDYVRSHFTWSTSVDRVERMLRDARARR